MIKMIKSLLPAHLVFNIIKFKNNYFDGYSLKSYSQEGEDMILNRIFENNTSGFYVDVGAHHPFRFSNTYFFYKRGWRGINIDALPGSMETFDKFRPRDINIEQPVAKSEQLLTYYSFNEPALNGFSKALSMQRHGKNGYFIKEEIQLKTVMLSTILDKYLPKRTIIDFLSIDVEGFDLDILLSNDWKNYIPKVILIEILESSIAKIDNQDISIFLKNRGYVIIAKTINTVIFKLDERPS